METYCIDWSARAISDFSDCVTFLKNVSLSAAKELVHDIDLAVLSLSSFPEKNPVFIMPKSFPLVIRKLIVKKRYIVLYSIEEQTIVIYRVLDARRKFDSIL